jgi:UDP-N-acetylglucosamine acyltransferase
MHIPSGGYRPVEGAWIHPRAKIAEGVVIEPGAVVGADVEVGRGSWIGAGAVIYGPTVLGEENQVWPTAVLGAPPQDLEYAGQPTRLVIGHRNVFREGFTANRASTKGDGVTVIGDGNFFMTRSHIGHDCVVENNVILANNVDIGGHCRIGSNVVMGGGTAIVQFTTVGRYAFIGGLSGTTMDCEPFLLHDDMPAKPKGINVVGLRRGKFNNKSILALKEAYRVLFSETSHGWHDLEGARAEIEKRGAICAEVEELLEFMKRSQGGRFGRQSQPHAKMKVVPETQAEKKG